MYAWPYEEFALKDVMPYFLPKLEDFKDIRVIDDTTNISKIDISGYGKFEHKIIDMIEIKEPKPCHRNSSGKIEIVLDVYIWVNVAPEIVELTSRLSTDTYINLHNKNFPLIYKLSQLMKKSKFSASHDFFLSSSNFL